MDRVRNSIGPIVGYHGCDRSVAESVLSGKSHLQPSKNSYDWLGPGIYFWADSPERGYEWAVRQSELPRAKVKNPYVIGAFIHPGLCLNLTDYGVMDEIRNAHSFLTLTTNLAKTTMPKNEQKANGIFLKRHLDCAVINTVHELRKGAGKLPYESVYGVFEEGTELFSGSGFKEKTHIQLAVRDVNCILGYFRVSGYA